MFSKCSQLFNLLLMLNTLLNTGGFCHSESYGYVTSFAVRIKHSVQKGEERVNCTSEYMCSYACVHMLVNLSVFFCLSEFVG